MTTADPPLRPTSEHDLDFRRRSMVGWFNPTEVLRVAVQAYRTAGVISLVDEREIQAFLADAEEHDYSASSEMWFDYVADLGDGFDSTYSVAYALAQPVLGGERSPQVELERLPPPLQLPRGQVLIMGGDQVYPVASRENYEDRFIGPYRAALPFADPPLDVFAIPGNHDWYDGLVSFVRLFCQPRWIGAWRTRQRRSYFALQLPQNWWLWATDIQLERDIDRPQMRFFSDASHKLQKGDRVILCTAEPSWIQAAFGSARPYAGLSFIERNLIEARGATLAVTLSGDRHNYARYETGDGSGKQKINAGGGGAFLVGTHDLPADVTLSKGGEAERWVLRAAYPDIATSRRLMWRTLGLLWISKWCGGVLAMLYMLYAWILQSASRRDLMTWPRQRWPELDPIPNDSLSVWLRSAGTSFLDTALTGSPAQTIHAFFAVLVRSPSVAAFTAAITAVLIVFALSSRRQQNRSGRGRAVLFGVLHASMHLGLGLGLLVFLAVANVRILGWPIATVKGQVLLGVEMTILGTVLGSFIMALYLITSNYLVGLHDQEVFSAQANPNYKNFLRLHIDASGALRIYPIGIDSACRWDLEPKGEPTDPWFRPRGGRPLRAHLIEPPIIVR